MGYTKSAPNRPKRPVQGKSWLARLLKAIGLPIAVLLILGFFVVPQAHAAASDTSAVYLGALPTAVTADVQGPKYRWPFVTFGISQYFHGGHPGIDLTNPEGTPIYPITDGVVLEVNAFPDGYGRHVIVKHDDTTTSLYAHMSKVHVTAGQKVDKNTVLGEVGATGWATGNHLHLEIRTNGESQNPLEILPKYKVNEETKAVALVIAPPPLPSLSL